MSEYTSNLIKSYNDKATPCKSNLLHVQLTEPVQGVSIGLKAKNFVGTKNNECEVGLGFATWNIDFAQP